MSQLKPVSESLTDNTIRTYYALEEAMFTAHQDDRNDEAETTARILLENADLPLLIRARACMVLGCLDVPDFLDMAKEAVRIIDVGIAQVTDYQPGQFVTAMRADAVRLLQEAQEAFDEEEKEEEEAGELVWEASEEQDLPAMSMADQLKIKETFASASGSSSAAYGLPTPATSKAVSRMHSGNTDKSTTAPARRTSRLNESALPPEEKDAKDMGEKAEEENDENDENFDKMAVDEQKGEEQG